MKIYTTPFEMGLCNMKDHLQDHLRKMTLMLTKVSKTLKEQKKVLNKMHTVLNAKHEKKKLEAILNNLADEIDSISEKCTHGTVKLLDGRFSRASLKALMWFQTGVGGDERKRIFIQTMTSRSLGLREGTGSVYSWKDPEGLKYYQEYSFLKILRMENYIKATIERLNFIKSGLNSNFSYNLEQWDLEKDIQGNQLALLRFANSGLTGTYRLLNRIKKLALEIKPGSTNEINRLQQVEVSVLVDEIDRIASQTVFNDMRLLLGDYSRVSRKASMWFLTNREKSGLKRIFIQTFTAQSLALRAAYGESVDISKYNKELFKTLDEAIERVDEEKDLIISYISYFGREDSFDRDIRIKGGDWYGE